MFAIARMSKKASLIYLILLSSLFLASLILLLAGLIQIDPVNNVYTESSIPLVVCCGISLFVSVFGVALTTIASNYVRKNAHKDPKLNQKEDR